MSASKLYHYSAKVTRVVDGDTIDVVLDLGFDVSLKARVRFFGIDAPESRTRDAEEKIREELKNSGPEDSNNLENVKAAISNNENLHLVNQLEEAVRHLHKNNIVHGAIKQDNIVVFDDRNASFENRFNISSMAIL